MKTSARLSLLIGIVFGAVLGITHASLVAWGIGVAEGALLTLVNIRWDRA